MSLKVVELNDSALKVGDETGILVRSPGFALAVGKSLQLGDEAESQARLQPTNSYNKYWHELSLEPLNHGNNIRHYADIAFAQLLNLAELGEVNEDVIFAVPGNFTRQQLAILLGLAQQSPFTPVGVVDSALAAAISVASSRPLIYADIQLHQVVLTKLQNDGNEIKSDSVIQVPGVGNQNFMDLMMQTATGLFIQQCRFNPQHNAESEQELYNALPNWLSQSDDNKNSLILELKTPSTVHTAKMPRESLINNLSVYHQKINKQIESLMTEADTQILISRALADLPGYSASLKNIGPIHIVDNDDINRACFEHRENIFAGEGGIHLVSSLPLISTSTKGAIKVASEPAAESTKKAAPDTAKQSENPDYTLPTHALIANQAFPVEGVDIENRVHLNGSSSALNKIFISAEGAPQKLGRIEKQGADIWLECGEQSFQLNDSTVTGRQKLILGDRIMFQSTGEEIRLIRVSN